MQFLQKDLKSYDNSFELLLAALITLVIIFIGTWIFYLIIGKIFGELPCVPGSNRSKNMKFQLIRKLNSDVAAFDLSKWDGYGEYLPNEEVEV